ncbi:MAG: STAS domain-containing protein [Limnochordia bacterium]
MDISHRRLGNILLVKLNGELDLVTAPVFREIVDGQLENFERLTHLILDLAKVDFIDSSGLGAILGRYKRIAQRGGQLLLTNGKPQVLKIIELSGMGKILPHYQNTQQALARIRGEE